MALFGFAIGQPIWFDTWLADDVNSNLPGRISISTALFLLAAGLTLALQPHGKPRKLHLFDVNLVDVEENYKESSAIEPGDEPLVVETPFGNLGVAICYDLRFPELFRTMLTRKPDIIALPSAFTAATGRAHWEPLVRARAIENLCYVIAAAQGGFHVSGRETWGHSMIVDPWGTILVELPNGAGHVTAELDIELLRTTRRNFPSLDHRRIHCQL
jgi:nitrilase